MNMTVCTYSSIIAKDVSQPGSQTIFGTELDAPTSTEVHVS